MKAGKDASDALKKAGESLSGAAKWSGSWRGATSFEHGSKGAWSRGPQIVLSK